MESITGNNENACVNGASTGSPREILQLGYKIGFINDSEVWLLMLKKRNTSVSYI